VAGDVGLQDASAATNFFFASSMPYMIFQLLPFKVADLLLRGLDFVPERLIFVVFADLGLLGLVFRQLALAEPISVSISFFLVSSSLNSGLGRLDRGLLGRRSSAPPARFRPESPLIGPPTPAAGIAIL
jgi:hypothetical protein